MCHHDAAAAAGKKAYLGTSNVEQWRNQDRSLSIVELHLAEGIMKLDI